VVETIFAGEPIPSRRNLRGIVPRSIFLAGPTPRSDDVETWRKEALDYLHNCGFHGYVFVPETEEWGWLGDYDRQVHWEWRALGAAQTVLFWVPRELGKMPAFTTNVEFGFVSALKPESVVLGFPKGAPKTRYLESLARDREQFVRAFFMTELIDQKAITPFQVCHSLNESLMACLARLGPKG